MPPALEYVKMKNSGIEWISDVPSHWGIRTLYQLASQVKNKNSNLEEQNLLSLSYGKIKRKDINSNDGLLPASFDGYNIIEAGDIVLRLTDLQNDHTSLRVGLATERGIITSAYITLRPSDIRYSKYLYYLLHAFDIKKGFYGMGSGVRQGLNYGEVKELRIVAPPVDEMQSIVSFLDEQCAIIDEIIAKTKTSIEDYGKWKTSIINEIVTEDNKDWIIGNVGRFYSIILGKMLQPVKKTDDESFESFMCAANIKWTGIKLSPLKKMWFSTNEKERYLLREGDLLVSEGGDAGVSCIWNCELQECYIQNSIHLVRSSENNTKYLYYWLFKLKNTGWIDSVCNRATIAHFTKEKLSKAPIKLPSVTEQGVIVDKLDKICISIDRIINEKQILISDLEAYKQSLVYEVVTGKRKVV